MTDDYHKHDCKQLELANAGRLDNRYRTSSSLYRLFFELYIAFILVNLKRFLCYDYNFISRMNVFVDFVFGI